MNAELEALIQSLQNLLEAGSGPEAERCEEIYQTQLNDIMATHPGLSREALIRAVDLAHLRWLRSQQKPPTMPPKA
jgi:hypothetical protein